MVKRLRRGYSLIEIMVSLTVFSIVMAMVGAGYFQLNRNWQKQRDQMEVITNAQWAIEYLSNRVRHAEKTKTTGSGNSLKVEFNGVPGQQHRFQRGAGINSNIFEWRLQGNDEEIADCVVDNPGNADIFGAVVGSGNSDLCPVMISFGKHNKNMTLSTTIRTRN